MRLNLTSEMKKKFIKKNGVIKYIKYRTKRLILGKPSIDCALYAETYIVEGIKKGINAHGHQ